MSHPPDAHVEDKIDFKWGNKRGVGQNNKDVQFYESFTCEGVEYFLYDCVYFYQTGDFETSIGKLVRIYETPTHEKKVKVVWFFRPVDICNFLGDYQPHWKELFLASGEGKGVSNVNFLEDITGKCSVVCTAEDKRNFEPSEAELKMADFFFKHSFDVGRLSIMDKFADLIGGVKVEQFFNRKKVQKISNPISRPRLMIKKGTDPLGMPHCQVEDKAEVRPENVMPKKTLLNSFPYKKRKDLEDKLSSSESKESTMEEDFDNKREKMFHKVAPELGSEKVVKNYGEFIEVTERPGNEKRRWFKQLPWEERLRKAQELGSLILLNNLDPSYTSYEVEDNAMIDTVPSYERVWHTHFQDLVWHTLNERVEARMIEWSPTFNPHYGRAFVIFKTKDAAESAISQLNKRCLILGDRRAVSAMKGGVREPGEQTNFPGHLVIDRSGLHKQREEMKNAVSTSHCSQPNTIEYRMAFDWRALQQKSDAWWNALYQKQTEEIRDVKRRLKMEET